MGKFLVVYKPRMRPQNQPKPQKPAAPPSPYQEYRKRLAELLGRAIAYHPGLACITGDAKSALMLSQLLYWNGNPRAIERDGWFYKSMAELEKETGLTLNEQRGARTRLINSGFIECCLRGTPPTWWYKVCVENVTLAAEQRMQNSDIQASENHIHKDVKNRYISIGKTDIQASEKPIYEHRKNRYTSIGKTDISYIRLTHENTALTTADITSSSCDALPGAADLPQTMQEDEVFSDVENELLSFGIFPGLIPEIRCMDYSPDQLRAAMQELAGKNGKAPALLMYRLRRNYLPRVPAENRNKYKADLEKYGLMDDESGDE